MTNDLKPCPFCGGEPEFRKPGGKSYYIACTGCDASSALFTALKDDALPHVVEAWNLRVMITPMTEAAVA